MSHARSACTGCELPFYTDVNESCPYCGQSHETTIEEGSRPDTDDGDDVRERVACDDCGLPYYADVETCPYCDTGDETTSDTTESGFEFEKADDREASHGERRPRIECDDCGLPYYEDAETCPYCTVEENTDTAAETVDATADDSHEPSTTPSADGTESTRETKPWETTQPSILGRLTSKLKILVGRSR